MAALSDSKIILEHVFTIGRLGVGTIQAKSSGYIERQRQEVERHERQESMLLPGDLDYHTVRGLSIEAQQKLNLHKPETIGQASRISGVTPAAISLLLVHLKKRGISGFATLQGADVRSDASAEANVDIRVNVNDAAASQ